MSTTAGIAASVGDVSESQIAIGDHIMQVNVRDGATVHLSAPGATSRPTPRPRPVQLRPRPLPAFLDRAGETTTARAALDAGELVEVTGVAGVGKTALLRRLAQEPLSGELPDGLVYLDVRGVVGEDLLRLVHSCFFEVPARYQPTDGELLTALADVRALVLLDDVALLREEVMRVLNALPRCVFVLASEERRAWGEARALTLAGLPAEEALALFQHELGRRLTDEERPHAQALCAQAAGQPLRVLQLASQARETGWLTTTTPDPDEDQRALLVLLQALGAPAQAAHLSELAGVADVEPVLASLVARRLVVVVEGRYQLAPGAGIAGAEAEVRDARQRALTYFTAWAEAHGDHKDAIVAEHGLLLALQRQAAAAHDLAGVLRIGRAVEPALMLSGRWGAWRDAVQLCRSAARAAHDPAAEGWSLHQLGTLDLVSGDAHAAGEQLRAALQLREAAGDSSGAAATRHNLGLLRPPAPPPRPDAREWLRAHRGVVAGVGGAALLGVGLVGFIALRPRAIEVHPRAVAFGEQTIGAPAARRELVVENGTREVVRLAPAALESAPDFRIVASSCGAELAPGGSCNIVAEFAPRDTGARGGVLRVRDELGHAVAEVALDGYGRLAKEPRESVVAPPHGAARIVTQPLEWDPVALGSASRSQAGLANGGSAAVRLGALVLTGDPDFKLLADGCSGTTLGPGQQCTLDVEFRPSAAGPRAGFAQVRSMDNVQLALMRFSGSGRAPEAGAPPQILRFDIDSAGLRSEHVPLRLCWGVASATRLVIEPGVGEDPLPLAGCRPIPFENRLYRLRAFGDGGQEVVRETAVRYPPVRIDGFEATPAAIAAGEWATLFYRLRDAFVARIEPVGALDVEQLEGRIRVRPTSTTVYTLVAGGIDGSRDQRALTVTVRPSQEPTPGGVVTGVVTGVLVDRQAPPPPRLGPPGVPVEGQAPAVTCRPLTASWFPVADRSEPVNYDVTVQVLVGGESWEDRLRQSTTGTRLDLSHLLPTAEGTHRFRWTVRARDAAGNASGLAPWSYYLCAVLN